VGRCGVVQLARCQHQWTWPLARRRLLRHTGSADGLAGVAVRRLDSAAASDGGAHCAVCFTLVLSCALGAKSVIYDYLDATRRYTAPFTSALTR